MITRLYKNTAHSSNIQTLLEGNYISDDCAEFTLFRVRYIKDEECYSHHDQSSEHRCEDIYATSMPLGTIGHAQTHTHNHKESV